MIDLNGNPENIVYNSKNKNIIKLNLWDVPGKILKRNLRKVFPIFINL